MLYIRYTDNTGCNDTLVSCNSTDLAWNMISNEVNSKKMKVDWKVIGQVKDDRSIKIWESSGDGYAVWRILHDFECARELWLEFGDVPLIENSDDIDEEWNGFERGTCRFDIWHWFEETFQVSVAKDLMGL